MNRRRSTHILTREEKLITRLLPILLGLAVPAGFMVNYLPWNR